MKTLLLLFIMVVAGACESETPRISGATSLANVVQPEPDFFKGTGISIDEWSDGQWSAQIFIDGDPYVGVGKTEREALEQLRESIRVGVPLYRSRKLVSTKKIPYK
jgi:hypothetical protein